MGDNRSTLGRFSRAQLKSHVHGDGNLIIVLKSSCVYILHHVIVGPNWRPEGVNGSMIKILSTKNSVFVPTRNPSTSLLQGQDNIATGSSYLRNQVGKQRKQPRKRRSRTQLEQHQNQEHRLFWWVHRCSTKIVDGYTQRAKHTLKKKRQH